MNPSFLRSLGFAVAAFCSISAGAAPLAYVGNQQDGTISIIDTVRDEVVRTIPQHGSLGKKIQAVVTDPAGKTAFVVDADGNAVVVVDLATGEVRQRIMVGASPEGATLSPSGKTLAVCVEEDNVVALVDVASATVKKRITTQGKNPEHCVFTADERRLVTTNEDSNDIDIIDLKAGKSIARIATSGHPRGIALVGKGTAYIAQETSGGVDIVDLVRHVVTGSIATGVRPADAIASRDGRRVFVANGGDGTVAAIDVATGKVTGSATVGKRAWNMALTASLSSSQA